MIIIYFLKSNGRLALDHSKKIHFRIYSYSHQKLKIVSYFNVIYLDYNHKQQHPDRCLPVFVFPTFMLARSGVLLFICLTKL